MNLCPQSNCDSTSHDTASAWRLGCRSEAARRALLRAAKQRRHGLYQPRLVDDVSVGRKLQALAVIGWHIDALADELGITRWGVNKLRTRTRHNVTNIKKVADLYDRLSMTPGGDNYTARIARARQWPGPLCWDDIDDPAGTPETGGVDEEPDENAVDAIIAQRVTWDQLSRLDQEHVATTLLARGWGGPSIAERAGTHRDAVKSAADRMRARQRRGAA